MLQVADQTFVAGRARDLDGLLRGGDRVVEPTGFGIGGRERSQHDRICVTGAMGDVFGELDCARAVANGIVGRSCKNPGEVHLRVHVAGIDIERFFQMRQRAFRFATLQQGQPEIILRVGIVRPNSQRFFRVCDRFTDAAAAHEKIRETRVREIIVVCHREGAVPKRFAIAPVGGLHAGEKCICLLDDRRRSAITLP